MPRCLKLATGLALLLVPFAFVDWTATLGAVVTAAPLPLVLAFLVLAVNVPLSAVKWMLLLHVQAIRPGFPAALQAYWIGSFFSNYLPSNVSGDVVRLVVLRAEGRRAEAASSILVERLSGLVVLVALAALGLTLRPAYFDRFGVLELLWMLVLVLAAGMTLVFVAGAPLGRWLQRRGSERGGLAQRLMTTVGRVALSLAVYRRRPGVLLGALALSLPFYGFLIVFQYLILRAVGATLPLAEVALVAPLVQLVGLLPLAPNGLGLVEGAFVLFFAQAGVAPEIVLAGALLRRILSFAVSLVGGLIWLHRAPPPARPARAEG